MSDMVTVSSKYEIVIPKSVREQVGIKPGQKMRWLVKGDSSITLVPVLSLDELQGFAKGINTENYRDEEDRF